MRDMKTENETRELVRKFLSHAKNSMKEIHRRKVLGNLSPHLKGRVAGTGLRFIDEDMCVWLRGGSSELKATLIASMRTEAFPPRESIPPRDCMCILTSGTVSAFSFHRGISKLITAASSRNTVWNEDMVLDNHKLRHMLSSSTITFAEVDVLYR